MKGDKKAAAEGFGLLQTTNHSIPHPLILKVWFNQAQEHHFHSMKECKMVMYQHDKFHITVVITSKCVDMNLRTALRCDHQTMTTTKQS